MPSKMLEDTGWAEARERLMETMLECCGDLGYRRVTVKNVLERSGVGRFRFYELFASKADCYAVAYGAHADRLCAALLGSCEEGDTWRAGIEASLAELARFASRRPLLARGMLVEVHVAGRPALDKRKEVFERLSRAIDGARRETRSRHSPPPLTAPLMVSTIDAAVASALSKEDTAVFAKQAVPELVEMAVAFYAGTGRRGG